MPLANIGLTDTFDTWRVRTNQLIQAQDQSNTIIFKTTANAAAAYGKANAANVFAVTVGAASNTWANLVGTSANATSVSLVAASNTWSNLVGTSANARSSYIGTSGNAFASYVAISANAYMNTVTAAITGNTAQFDYSNTVGSRANSWANTIGTISNTFASSVAVSANAYANLIGTRANNFASSAAQSSNLYSNYVGISANGYTNTLSTTSRAVSNSWANIVGSSGNSYVNYLIASAVPVSNTANQASYLRNGNIQTSDSANSIYIGGNQINGGTNEASDNASIYINFSGYQNGTTYFRNLNIYDGKRNLAAYLLGSNKSLYVYGDVIAFATSDARLKANVYPISSSLSKLELIRGVEFDWTDEFMNTQGGEDGYLIRKHDVGVIAQELQTILPEAVATREDGTMAVKYEKIIPLLIEAIKELKNEIDILKRRL